MVLPRKDPELEMYNDYFWFVFSDITHRDTLLLSNHLQTSYLDTFKIDEETGTSQYPEMTFIIDLVDNVCAVYFAMEYFMRLICSPKKIKFFFRRATNKEIRGIFHKK